MARKPSAWNMKWWPPKVGAELREQAVLWRVVAVFKDSVGTHVVVRRWSGPKHRYFYETVSEHVADLRLRPKGMQPRPLEDLV